MDFDRDLHRGGVAVGVAVGQRELAALVPIEPDGGLVFSQRSQPGDEPGFAVVRDDGHLAGLCRNDLLVVRIVADQRL